MEVQSKENFETSNPNAKPTFIGETFENFKEGFINMKKDFTEFGSSIVSGIKNVVITKNVDPKDRIKIIKKYTLTIFRGK